MYRFHINDARFRGTLEEVDFWVKQQPLAGNYYHIHYQDIIFSNELDAVAFKLHFGHKVKRKPFRSWFTYLLTRYLGDMIRDLPEEPVSFIFLIFSIIVFVGLLLFAFFNSGTTKIDIGNDSVRIELNIEEKSDAGKAELP